MSRFRYNQDMLDFLQSGYRQMQVPELTLSFNQAFGTSKTEATIKTCLTNHRFTCGRPTGSPKGAFRIFTKAQASFIRAEYRNITMVDLTSLVNDEFGTKYSIQQIRSFTRNHQVRSGRTGHFVKGSMPWNNGTKGLMKPNSGSFQRGTMNGAAARNYKPIGSLRTSKDGYLEKKVTDDPSLYPARRWVGVHRLVWQEGHGEIPRGHVVVFLDGDKTNLDPDNLRCVPRGVLQYLNKSGLNETFGEARKAAILTAELATKAFSLERGGEQGK